MRIVVEWPEMQQPRSEFFEHLKASGGRWVEIPGADQLAIPGGKILTESQLAGILDSSINSDTKSLEEIERRLSLGGSEG